MASNFDVSTAVTKAAVDTGRFVPEIWIDEVIATYKKALVLANLIRKVNVEGKPGDAVNIPGYVRGSATAKTANTAVVPEALTTTGLGAGVQVSLNQHWYWSRLIEDIAQVQSKQSLRSIYTEDAGYTLAKKIDSVLHDLASGWQSGAGTATYDKAVIGSDGSTNYTSGANNAAPITDAAIRKVIQTLDDADVPMENRSLVIPPVARNTLMGLARFTEQAFVGDAGGANTIHTGRLGNVYGVEVYVSSQCPTATGGARIASLFHKDASVLCMQQAVRMQNQYKLEALGTLLVADTIFGCAEYRDAAGVAIAVTA